MEIFLKQFLISKFQLERRLNYENIEPPYPKEYDNNYQKLENIDCYLSSTNFGDFQRLEKILENENAIKSEYVNRTNLNEEFFNQLTLKPISYSQTRNEPPIISDDFNKYSASHSMPSQVGYFFFFNIKNTKKFFFFGSLLRN